MLTDTLLVRIRSHRQVMQASFSAFPRLLAVKCRQVRAFITRNRPRILLGIPAPDYPFRNHLSHSRICLSSARIGIGFPLECHAVSRFAGIAYRSGSGDFSSLCGFGKSLDQRFRGDVQVKATFTLYGPAGLSLSVGLNESPSPTLRHTADSGRSGRIPDAANPREYQDTYGMKRGIHVPNLILYPNSKTYS